MEIRMQKHLGQCYLAHMYTSQPCFFTNNILFSLVQLQNEFQPEFKCSACRPLLGFLLLVPAGAPVGFLWQVNTLLFSFKHDNDFMV